MWPVTLSGRLPVNALVGHHPANKLIGRDPIPCRKSISHPTMRWSGASGITTRFQELFRCTGQVGHALLTRSPLSPRQQAGIPFDLHVLSTPPAFILSQNRTLHKNIAESQKRLSNPFQKKSDGYPLIRKGSHTKTSAIHQNPTGLPTRNHAGGQRNWHHKRRPRTTTATTAEATSTLVK